MDGTPTDSFLGCERRAEARANARDGMSAAVHSPGMQWMGMKMALASPVVGLAH